MLGLSGVYEAAFVGGRLEQVQRRLFLPEAEFVHDLVGDGVRHGGPDENGTLPLQSRCLDRQETRDLRVIGAEAFEAVARSDADVGFEHGRILPRLDDLGKRRSRGRRQKKRTRVGLLLGVFTAGFGDKT